MKRTLIPVLALVAWMPLAPAISAAQGITGIVSDNRSTPDNTFDNGYFYSEFRSHTSAQPALWSDNVASFSHRMAWFGGVLTDPGFIDSQHIRPSLAYNLSFTVEDPQNQGYSLRVDSELRGVLAALGGGFAIASARLQPIQVTAWAAFDPQPIELPELTNRPRYVEAFGLQFRDEFSVDEQGRAVVGHWHGTRSFLLTVNADPFDLRSNVIDLGIPSSLAFMQFGLMPTVPRLGAGSYTGAGSPSINDLGHFLNVRAMYDIPAVPEPATALLWVCGLAVWGLRKRRRVAPAATSAQSKPFDSQTAERRLWA